MFNQLVKRSNAVWIYSTGRFAEERRTFLCDLNERGHSLYTLRKVNKFLLVIAERVNVRQRMPITEVQIVRAAKDWAAKSCALSSTKALAACDPGAGITEPRKNGEMIQA
jgi:hypothetical protein